MKPFCFKKLTEMKKKTKKELLGSLFKRALVAIAEEIITDDMLYCRKRMLFFKEPLRRLHNLLTL